MSQQLLHRVDEAAQRLGCGRSTIYELVKRGDLKMVHIGRRALIPAAELEAYVEQLQKA